MAVILRSKLSVVWSEIVWVSGPAIVAASESGESRGVVQGILLPRPPPLWLPILAAGLCSPVGKASMGWASSSASPRPLLLSGLVLQVWWLEGWETCHGQELLPEGWEWSLISRSLSGQKKSVRRSALISMETSIFPRS